jgi:flavin reductase (DIM6/NTAB) family NADH-FMN oxidoreductase RutF
MTKKIELGPNNSLFPMPTVVVGANVNGKPNYLTIAWCGIMGGSPPLISVALRRSRFSSPGIKENQSFSVNIPSTDLVKQADYVGIVSGHKADKSGIFKTFYGKLETAPMIEECRINLECKLFQILDFGHSHEIFVGEIVQVYADEDCLTDGNPDISKIDPIIFSTGDHNYWKVGERVASAFSVGKDYTP